MLAESHRTIAYELNLILTNARSEIQESLLREIQREQKSCKDAAAVLADRRQKKHTDVSARLRELTNALRLLDNLESTMKALDDSPAAEPDSRSASAPVLEGV